MLWSANCPVFTQYFRPMRRGFLLRFGILGAAGAAVVALAVPAAVARDTRPTVSTTLSRSTITVGSSTVISGRVRPGLPHRRVYLQLRGQLRWNTVQRHRLSRWSHYSFTVRPGRAGTFAYRVVSPPHIGGVHRAVSRTVRLTVRARTTTQDCTPGYSPCIPPGPDVDCAGGSGDGPRYVQGPVRVYGSDPYGLDSDGDGWGCES